MWHIFFLNVGHIARGGVRIWKNTFVNSGVEGVPMEFRGLRGVGGIWWRWGVIEKKWFKSDFLKGHCNWGVGVSSQVGGSGGLTNVKLFLKASRKYIPSSWLLWIRLLRSRKATRPQKLPRMARNLKSCGKIVNVVFWKTAKNSKWQRE